MLITFGAAALQLTPPNHERLATARRFEAAVTGPESNAAVAARHAGRETTWCSVLADSPLGRRVAGELREHDVRVRATYRDGRQGLTFYERGRSPRSAGRVDDRADPALARVEGGDLPLDAVRDAAGVYVTGATPALSTPAAEAAARFLKAGADGGALTALGLEHRPARWSADEARDALTGFFPAVDVLVATDDDVARVLGRDGQASEVAHALASEHGFETVALLREQTTAAWHEATVYEFPVLETDAVDPTGARDAFAGVFLAELLDGGDTGDALRAATAAHALARTTPGPVPRFTRAELDRTAADVGDEG